MRTFGPGEPWRKHIHNTEFRKTLENRKLGVLPLAISYDPPGGGNWGTADIVFFETPNGGAVFSPGSLTWISSTPENDYNNDVVRITLNVITRFLAPTPFPPFPPIRQGEVDSVYRVPFNLEYEHADQK